jgi:hypothetical protein
MSRAEHDRADEIRAELARQGIAVGEDDIADIVKIVAANRAGLERARTAVSRDPEVPHGFVLPAPPAVERPPHAGR